MSNKLPRSVVPTLPVLGCTSERPASSDSSLVLRDEQGRLGRVPNPSAEVAVLSLILFIQQAFSGPLCVPGPCLCWGCGDGQDPVLHLRNSWTQDPEITAQQDQCRGRGKPAWGIVGPEGSLSRHGGLFREGFPGEKTPLPTLNESARERQAKVKMGKGKGVQAEELAVCKSLEKREAGLFTHTLWRCRCG